MDIAGNRTLYSIFAAYTAQQPEREWLVYERGDGRVFRWTYAEFLDSVHQAANLLRSLSIGSGDVFNLHLSNHPAYPQLILAASYLGAAAMPSNPVGTPDELGYLVEHSNSKIIFTQADCLDVVGEITAQLTGRRVLLCQTDADLPDDLPLYETELADQPVDPPPGQEVTSGEQGQIIVRGIPGRTLMLGYLNNPEATAETLRMHHDAPWLYSGDTVYADEDGFLYFLDRGKDLIKRSGENISSIEVEAAILDFAGVLDACVVGMSDEIRDEAVVAVIVQKPDGDLTAEAVQAHCAQRLAPFKVPDRVEFTDVLPRTSVGKIQKQTVRERLGGSHERSGGSP